MSLTVKRIDSAKAKDKLYRIADSRGLSLEVAPNGSKRWRFRYRFNDKGKMLSLGTYPETSLRDARDERERLRGILAKGIDPAAERKQEKAEDRQDLDSFEAIAREWHKKFTPKWSKGHGVTILSRLTNNVFPWLGHLPIASIEAPDILQQLRRIESRGALETAHRVRGIIGQVFRYAVATGRAKRNPAADLKGALPPSKGKHLASITDKRDIGALLRAIDDYEGHHVTRCALKLAPLVFVRPGELRHAEWSEIDFDGAEWHIPAEKMKGKRPHIVPLSRQALDVLHEIHPLTGHRKYVFPGVRTTSRPMSENTVNGALRRLGYTKEQMTGHGFRAMASTNLNMMGWNPDAIERQLAHVEGNSVRAAYNHADYLDERTKMMQAWADFLDSLKEQGKVIPIKAANE